MSRFKSRVGWMLAAAAIVVVMSQVAEAQREGGRRGRGGRGGFGGGLISSVQLVAESDAVQQALSLNDDQKSKVGEINDHLREDRRNAIQERGRDFGAARGEIEKLNQEATEKLAEVLDANQQKRLLGISIQVNGAAAVNDPAVAKELEITDEQKTKLEEVRDTNMQAARDAFEEMQDQDLSRDQRRAKMEELRTNGDKNIMAVLSSDQQAKLESLKGEPVEVDMSDFRRGFGGGGFGRGGRDGGGRRGTRDRDRGADRDNSENSGDNGA